MNLKKILMLLVALVMLAALTACELPIEFPFLDNGNSDSTNDGTENENNDDTNDDADENLEGLVLISKGKANFRVVYRSAEGATVVKAADKFVEKLRSLGVDAKLGGRNDIEVSGRKISGNAQCKRGNRVLHHGTLLFDSNLEFLSGILSVDEEKIKSKAIKSTRSRVANLKELLPSLSNVDEFISLISEYVIRELS